LKRGIVIVLAVALGLGATWVWLARDTSHTHGEIDDASKVELERILREETGG
jgi:hypothetical protein